MSIYNQRMAAGVVPINRVNVLNKEFQPLCCIDISDAMAKLRWSDSTYINSTNAHARDHGYPLRRVADFIYDIEPATQISFSDHKGKVIRINSANFTPQNPLAIHAIYNMKMETEQPVRFKAMFIDDHLRRHMNRETFQIGNLIYTDGKVVVNPVVNPIL